MVGQQVASGPGTRNEGSAAAPQRNPWLILIVLCGAIFMLLLDTTIVNNAQQKIKEGLDADLSGIQWVLDSYILTYAVLLLSFGRMGDVFGRKKLFILGMSIFTAASALCAASAWLGDLVGISGVDALIISRVLQGLGGAFMMPQTLSLITVAFPPEKRGAAMGIWGGVVALGAVIGPIAGGLIVTHYAWEWVFLINVPIGIIAVLATIAIVPESVDPTASRKIDWGGVLLSGTGILALVYASIEGASRGWTSPVILGLIALSAVLLSLFVWWERRSPDPMMKIELFQIRNFWVGNLISLAVSFGMLGIFFPMTLFLQGALGFSPIRAGLTMTPMSLMILVAAPIAGRLTDRIGARWILVTGLSMMTIGIFMLRSAIAVDTTWRTLLPSLIVAGLGMGMTFAPMTAAVMAEVPPRIAGSASGILNTMRNVGQVLGIAVLGSVLQSRVGVHATERVGDFGLDPQVSSRVIDLAQDGRLEAIPAAVPTGQTDTLQTIFGAVQRAFVDSLHETFIVGALACAVALGVSLMLRNPARRTAPAGRPATDGERAGASPISAD